jgi:hypothetical protein
MGIAERRGTAEFRTNEYPALEKEITKLVGRDVVIEVDWETIAFEEQGTRYAELWKKLYFTPLIDAFEQIARDPLGRDALRKGVTKITITNRSGAYSPTSAIKVDKGEITIDHSCSNVEDVHPRTQQLVKLLEAKL